MLKYLIKDLLKKLVDLIIEYLDCYRFDKIQFRSLCYEIGNPNEDVDVGH